MGILFSLVYLAVGYRLPHFNTTTWAALLWLAIFTSAIARLFLFAGIKLAGSRSLTELREDAALLSPLETLLAILFAVWLLGESLTPQQWVGTLLVVASAALGAKAKSDPVPPKTTKATKLQSNAT